MLAGMGGSCLLAPSHRGLLSLSDSPALSVTSVKLPSRLLRYNALRHFVLDETDHGFTMTAS